MPVVKQREHKIVKGRPSLRMNRATEAPQPGGANVRKRSLAGSTRDRRARAIIQEVL
jgi:hypothetical protein